MSEKHENDRHRLVIAEGNRNLGKARNVQGNWERVRKKLSETHVDLVNTIATYQKLSPNEKTECKRVPGFLLAGPTDGGRSNNSVLARTMVNLDIDELTAEQFERWRRDKEGRLWNFEFHMKETRSSTDHAPRLRLIFPLKRRLNHQEYHAVSRILASMFLDDAEESMETVDDVSFRPAQLMFYSTASKDQKLEELLNRGKLLNGKALLKQWSAKHGLNWQDFGNLPFAPKRGLKVPTQPGQKMEDPFEKEGIIGAFCRAYPIEDAMAAFLTDFYEPAGDDNASHPRYTPVGSTASGGVVVYDDGRFVTSNHGSDPISERTVNSWDLVRICLFGDLDKEARSDTSPTSLPSFIAMDKMAQADPATKTELLGAKTNPFEDYFDDDEEDDEENSSERLDAEIDDLLGEDQETEAQEKVEESISSKFDTLDEEPENQDSIKNDEEEDRDAWKTGLITDKHGNPTNVGHNISLIVENDPRIAPCPAYDELAKVIVAKKQIRSKALTLPSQPKAKKGDPARWWATEDDVSIKLILSAPNPVGYEIEAPSERVDAAVLTCARKQAFHPVKDKLEAFHAAYLASGKASEGNLETWGCRWLRLPDNAYHRESALMLLVAAVARVYEPGCKWEQVVIISGEGGIRKSSLVKALSLGYFTELSKQFDRTDRMVESMTGAWFSEMPEVQALRKNDHNDAKEFISAQHDQVRLAYERRVGRFPRTTIVMGTANEHAVLRDPTGNRRYWPWFLAGLFDINNPIDLDGLIDELPMLYGEAVEYYRQWRKRQPRGELKLDLISEKARAIQIEVTDDARELTVHEIIAQEIETWLETPLSEAETQDGEAAMFAESDDDHDERRLFLRNVVTAKEAYEALHASPVLRNYRNADVRTYGRALAEIPGWVPTKQVRKWGERTIFYVRNGTGVLPDNIERFIELETEPDEDDLLG